MVNISHSKTYFQNGDCVMYEALGFHRFLSIEEQPLIQAYIFYLSYRVQYDLYELGKDAGLLDHLSWQDFVWAVRSHQRTRNRARLVAREAITRFPPDNYFNFEDTDTSLPFEDELTDDEGDSVYCSQLFSFDLGKALIDCLLLQIEIAQYRRQLHRGEDYAWEQFITELAADKAMWNEVMAALRGTLRRLDFKRYWPFEALEDLIMGEGGN